MKSATSGATSFYQLILQLMKLDKHYYLRDFSCPSKAMLSQCKRIAFATQLQCFWRAKSLLLECDVCALRNRLIMKRLRNTISYCPFL